MSFKILIGGDLVPTENNKKYFISGDIGKVIDEKILSILKKADYRIFNLEAPLTQSSNALSKEGPNIKAEIETVKGIKCLDANLITLANNHILDYNQEGLDETIKTLNENNINIVGAGKNLDEATKSFIFKIGDLNIGVYACTEHEYTLAQEDKGGANPFDPFESLDHIQDLKSKVDYLIVLYHGGKEFYRYPTPYLQKVCRKIIDKGADFVTCQHSHCIGTYENYKDGKILYGQGNFLFDRDDPINYEYKQTGLLIEIEFKSDKHLMKPFINYYPIKKEKEKIRLALKEEAQQIIEEFETRAKQIKEKGFIEENFDKVALRDGNRYLIRLSKLGTIISAVDNRFFKGKILREKSCTYYNLRQRHTLENMLQCEVHNEIVLRYLKLKNKGK